MSDGLHVEVARTPGRGDRFTAERADGSRASWVVPTYHAVVPHDLVHLVVEAAFDLRDGFWGRVAGGADPASLNEAVARRSGGWTNGSTELLQAEGLAAIHWYDPNVSVASRAEDVTERCAEFGVPPPAALCAEAIAETHAVLCALRRVLRAAGPCPRWTVDHEPRSPRRAFERLRDRLLTPGPRAGSR